MSCPICSSEDIVDLFEGGRIIQGVFGTVILKCKSCQFIFADNVHPALIDYYYTYICRHGLDEGVWGQLREDASENALAQFTTIKPYLPDKLRRVLDFGGGSGEAARLYLSHSESVYISESDPRALEYVREEKRLNVINPNELENEEYVGFFDLVIFSNVLEHMTHPLRRMEEMSRLIVPDGYLFVEVPNEAPFLQETGRHMPQHITFFTKETFTLLVETHGAFEIIDLRTCGIPLRELIDGTEKFHHFDRLETPDGWVIRALLKNVKPTVELTPIVLDREDCFRTIQRNSDTLCMLADRVRQV